MTRTSAHQSINLSPASSEKVEDLPEKVGQLCSIYSCWSWIPNISWFENT
jgi:hypothetical protein